MTSEEDEPKEDAAECKEDEEEDGEGEGVGMAIE